MKTKSFVLTLCALLGFASLPILAANQKDDSFTVSGNVTLNESRTVGYLDIKAGAWLDLNGYDLIIEHGSETVSAVITNSSATLSHISFTPHESNGWGAQFQNNLKFGGNLKLTVCGIVNSGTSWGQRGFGNAVNTHTGGTVLDGYGTNYLQYVESGDYGNLPEWNKTGAFGTGPLTLKNGAILRCTLGNSQFEYSKLVFDGDASTTNMIVCTTTNFDSRKPVESGEGSVLLIRYLSSWNRFMTADMTGVKGTIVFKGDDKGEFDIFCGAEYGRFSLAKSTDASHFTEIRFNGDYVSQLPDPIKVGMIESTSDLTEHDDYMKFRANFGSGSGFKNLQVGGTGLSGAYYGSICRHSNGADWNLEKAGAGTWTLGGNTHSEVYRGTTTLSGGMLKMADAGRLGTGNLVFNGGTLGFAASSTNTIGSAIVATDHPITVDADEGACGVLSGSTTGATAGLVKTGAGMVRLTGTKLVQNEGTSGKLMISSGNTGIGEVKTWEGGLGADELMLDAGQSLDLDGRDLMVRKVSQSSTAYGGSVVKNDSDTLATFTVGVGNGANANKIFAFQGNVRYVVTGNDGTHFRAKSDTAAIMPNTHTGGTVLSNLVNEVRVYGFCTNFGTGPLVFANGGKIFMPSQDADVFGDYKIDNAIEVYGHGNHIRLEGPSWGPGFNFNGKFSGDGELYIYNGWQPSFYFNGNDNDDFTGTLLLGYKRNEERGFYIGEYGNGFKNATVCLTNIVVSGNDTDVRATHLTCQQRGDDVYFGHLITGDLEGFTHEKTKVIANHGGTTTLHIGAKGLSGTFSGSFVEQDGKAFAIVKEGAGTWILDGTVASTVSGGITVNAGAIVLNTTLTGAVTVASGASFAGTVPSGGVTFESGAVVDGGESASITGDVNLAGTVVEVDDVSAVTDGQVFLAVTGTATGKPSLSAALAAVTQYNGKRGKWGVRATTENGVTTYSLVWKPTAFVVIIR